MSKVDLRVDFCSYEAAKFAVEHWHYSKAMPAGKTVKVGAWENGQFIGAVIYSYGANNNIGKPYGLKQTEVCELVRVALTGHISPVSKIVSIAQKMLVKHSPGLRLIVSYADPEQNHVGSVYQAMNWIYAGVTTGDVKILNKQSGEIIHKRTINSTYGGISRIPFSWEYHQPLHKHRYLYPLDPAMRQQIAPLAKPYPKRLPASEVTPGDTIGDQPIEGGSRPTRTL